MPPPAWREGLRGSVELARETVQGFSRDRGDIVAAALAFYTLLSIAPLIIVAVAIAGLVLGRGTARQELVLVLSDAMGTRVASTVAAWADEASKTSPWATATGLLLVVLGASRLTSQLRSALNQIWNIPPESGSELRTSAMAYVRDRLFSLLLVVATGPLLIAVIASRALLTGLHDVLFAGTPFAGAVVQLLQVSFSLVLVAVVTAVVFRVVPDGRVRWRPIWAGAVVTSVLFNSGNVVVGWYLGRATITAAYGAAGSGVVVLLWTYFSAHFFLLGAEFTQVYAKRRGAWVPQRSGSRRADS